MTKERFSAGNAKQKVTLIAVVLVVVIIIWQVMSLFSSSTPAPAPLPAKTMAAGNGGPSPANGQPQTPSGAPTTPPVDQLRQANLPQDPQFNKMQTATEDQYVKKLNELEDLKIQRQIAETNQAISTAKLATVTAEKDISDLLTKPAPAVPLPGSAYANQLVSPTTGGPPPGGMPVAVQVKEVTPTVQYSVISVTMQLGKWSAVLGYQDRLFNVSVGDILPPDHSVVTYINRNGVTLKKDGETRKISMISSI